MQVLDALGHALGVAGSMAWQITWSLILGFTLSGVVQAVIRRQTIIRLLGDNRPKTLAIATGLGAASSSCSYAAVALARALFRRGADFTAAMAFEIASTNLVIELGIIMAVLLGWQFTLAEFTGGPIMIVLMALAFRVFVRKRLIAAARMQADKGLAGSMEGHAAMDMSVTSGGTWWRRLFSRDGYTAVSHIFVMEWAAVIRDVVIGLLIAGAVGAWVPDSFWQHLFLTSAPARRQALGTAHRPGHLGAQLRLLDRQRAAGRGAVERRDQLRRRHRVHLRRPDHHPDPDHLPEVLRHQDDAAPCSAIFYAAMVAAAYIIEFTFGGLGLIPTQRNAQVTETAITWNYTTILNIIFLLLAAALLVRFFRSGGGPMLKMMGGGPAEPEHHTPPVPAET